MIGIYKITNPNGESYIGQTTNWKNRQGFYKNLICKKQPKIYASLLEYGIENHTYELIEECYLSKLDAREAFHKRKFIKEFGWEKALFYRIKDGKGGLDSDETKLKKSKSQKGIPKPKPKGFGEAHSKRMKGRKWTKEHCDNISKGNKGKIRTEEHLLNMSLAKKGISKPKNFGKKLSKLMEGKERGDYKTNKPILQYNKQGEFIKEWENQAQFCKALGVNDGWVNNCLNGRSKSIKGYILKYK